jgi:hypothetical protein
MGKTKEETPKKNTHTHIHFQSPNDQNTAHIAVATTKAIYLEEDIFTHKKNHTTLQKKPLQKAHLRPSLPHKITQPQNSNNNTPASLTTKSHNPKTKTTTHLLFYPQNTEPKTKTTTHQTTHLPDYPQKKEP